MRVTVLTTRTNNTPAFYEPLRTLGHELSIIVYDLLTAEGQQSLPQLVDMNRPDWVLMIGAHERFHDRPVPTVDILARVGAKHKLVHLCCDCAEPVWWEQTQRYHDHGRFALQVNIDGVRTGPIGEHGLTMLSPFESTDYPNPPMPWDNRPIVLGFPGSAGDQSHPRGQFMYQLTAQNLLMVRPRDDDALSTGFRNFLSACKAVWNAPWTGSNIGGMHVKGRVLEAAFAGCVLFEHRDAPTGDWFKMGHDYVGYANVADVRRGVEWIQAHPGPAKAMAQALRDKVLRDHSPEIFWAHVIERIGLGKTTHVLREPAFRPWRDHPAVAPIIFPPLPTPADSPVLVHSRGVVNFVQFDSAIYAIPQALGTVDLRDPTHRMINGIRRFASLEEAVNVAGG